MYLTEGVGGNAPTTPSVPPVPAWRRWSCPRCGGLYRHPYYLADHLARPAGRLGHEMARPDAWAVAAAVAPVDTTPGLARHPVMPLIPMTAPPGPTG